MMRFAAGVLYHLMRFFATPLMLVLVIGKWMCAFGAFAFFFVFVAGLSGSRLSTGLIALLYAVFAAGFYFVRIWYWEIAEKALVRSRR
jgi:hypothetical protein